MIFVPIRLLIRACQLGPEWWRWMLRTPTRLAYLACLLVAFTVAAVAPKDPATGNPSGYDWLLVPAGAMFLVIAFAPVWFIAGKAVRRARLRDNPEWGEWLACTAEGPPGRWVACPKFPRHKRWAVGTEWTAWVMSHGRVAARPL